MMEIDVSNKRLTVLSICILFAALIIVAKLFVLQILQGDYYSTLALSTHEIYKKIHPIRGEIFFRSAKDGSESGAAVNAKQYTVFAVPAEIKKDEVLKIADSLSVILSSDEEEKKVLVEKLSKSNDPYEPLAKKVDDSQVEQIKNLKLVGIYFTDEDRRFYPESSLAANVLGFYGFDNEGNARGSYGLEGYLDELLSGKSGLMLGETGAKGGWITLAGRTTMEAENGANIILTVDRALEYQACERLKQGFEEFKAKSASLIMMDVQSGAILAMCSFPTFDPNNYSMVDNVSVYNNTSVFTPYEPGSVFKPITMSVGLDLDLITPNTTFTDPCVIKMNGYEIKNANDVCYGVSSMTSVLENSINTGAMWVEEKIGPERFKNYINKFGFGEKTGIELATETAGDIRSLDKKGEIWGAVASFGQGIMVTPLQLTVAYATLANGGNLLRPYIVAEKRYANGKIEKTDTMVNERVLSTRASKIVTGMLVSVIENGHSKEAKSANYYLAGKTGTAQIAGKGGDLEHVTNHTFAGYGPASNPKIAVVVKYEQPERDWADSTVGPVFRDVMKFALEYLGVPRER